MADRFDVWTKQSIKFHNLEAARLALQDDDLLDPFFAAWIQKLDAVDAAREIKCSTAFARELPTHGVNVLMIGESGAGKSTLVKVMTGNEHIVVSATHAGTSCDTRYRSPCKINWVDTPGFKLPVSPEDATLNQQSTMSKWKDSFLWRRWLARIRSLLTAGDLSVRPSTVIYCHRASSRIVPERMLEVFQIVHELQVPLILAATDVCGIDDNDLKAVRTALQGLVHSLGPNGLNRVPSYIEINSESKTVRGHQHKVTGVKGLIEAVLNSLDPNYALQFLTRPWLYYGSARPPRGSAPLVTDGDVLIGDDEEEEEEGKAVAGRRRGREEEEESDSEEEQGAKGGKGGKGGKGSGKSASSAKRAKGSEGAKGGRKSV